MTTANHQPDELAFLYKLLQPPIRSRVEDLIKKRINRGPLIVEFDPTTTCNFECPECINIELLNKGQIRPSRATELLNEFNQAGVLGVIFIGGGEPLAHTSMPNLITHAYDLGMSVGLTTNGLLIHHHLEVLARCVQWTRVSIDAATQATFTTFRPSKVTNSFTKIINNVEKLAATKKGKVGYSFLMIERINGNDTPVTNCHEIAKAAKLARDIGCDYFEFKPTVNEHHNLVPVSHKTRSIIEEQLEELKSLNTNEFRIIYPLSVTHLLNSKSPDQPKNYVTCPTLELRTVVTPSGIYPCPYKRGYTNNLLGSIDVKFNDYWQSSERQKRTKQIDPRYDCKFYCIRHELNILLNVLFSSHADGVDLFRFLITSEIIDDIFI